MNPPQTSELKECPFCGGEASLGTMRYCASTIKEQGWAQDTFHFVNCCSCGSNNKGLVGYDSPTRAAAHWNHRTPSQREVEMERALIRIRDYPVHSEPVGAALEMSDIANETLKDQP